jgi:hypothetical protein
MSCMHVWELRFFKFQKMLRSGRRPDRNLPVSPAAFTKLCDRVFVWCVMEGVTEMRADLILHDQKEYVMVGNK